MKKRGISEVVSYVLLIVVAITISAIVFAFLKLYVPKEKPECKEGINLIIENVTCVFDEDNQLNNRILITLQNRGLFKVDKAYLRIGKTGRQFRANLGSNPHALFNPDATEGLNPSESYAIQETILPSLINAEGEYILEVQPAHFTENKKISGLALCPPVNQVINCG